VRRPRSDRASADRDAATQAGPEARPLERGQALVMFILMSLVMVGAVAIVTDISWVWYGQQRMQRAADAAALAGAIYLPGDPTTAYSTARAEATKNGFTDGLGGVVVTPIKDSINSRRLIVTVSGPVGSFFARALGITTFTTGAEARAEYVLPVPMGSPENYYGVGYYVATSSETHDETTQGSQQTGTSNSGLTWTYTPGDWTQPAAARTTDSAFATSANAVSSPQVWTAMGIDLGSAPAANQQQLILGLQVRVRARLSTAASSGCTLTTELSWDGGTSWSTGVNLNLASTSYPGTPGYNTQGSTSSTAAWGGHAWTRDDFSNGNFQLRLTFARTGTCQTNQARAQVDMIQVRVTHRKDTTNPVTTYSVDGQEDLVGPEGETIRRQGFWGSMQSKGAPNIQGDAFMTYYDTRTGVLNSAYDPAAYYQYGIDMPAGASNGRVWVYDPGFCDVTTQAGTGEYWTVGGTNGASSPNPITSLFTVYDTGNTPYDMADDTAVGTFGNDYANASYQDLTARNAVGSGSVSGNPPDCRGLGWHDGWIQIASGLTGGSGGKTYRLHTHSNADAQLSSTALNNFAFFAKASGGTPRIYGIGAMEAYARLPGGQSTEFYLAQIEDVHAGKTMIIELWDPGDTGALSASLEILKPTASDYVAANFSYTAAKNSTNGVSCNSQAGTNVTSVTTNTGGSSLFNGCWLSITIPLPASYTAPHPTSDTITNEGGWWKIRYTMGGSASNFSTDLTTWKVSIRGNPVHLVVP
jgi:hypothetical protein